jgi:hypothetical protein
VQKNDSFLTDEANNFIKRNKKRKKNSFMDRIPNGPGRTSFFGLGPWLNPTTGH